MVTGRAPRPGRSRACVASSPEPVRPPTKGTKPLRPEEVIVQAQKAARIEPSERGYVGQRGEHVYAWAPGKVYMVYLTKKQGTGIFLPPGERLVSGLYLDPEAYEVQTKRAGVGDGAYDALTIRPTMDSGEVEAFLLTESGRRYLLHLVVGSVGMLAVTFEGPRVTHAPHARTRPGVTTTAAVGGDAEPTAWAGLLVRDRPSHASPARMTDARTAEVAGW